MTTGTHRRVFIAWADPSTKVRWFDVSGNDNPDYQGHFRVGGAERFLTAKSARSPSSTTSAPC